jgi:hypothetical protein
LITGRLANIVQLSDEGILSDGDRIAAGDIDYVLDTVSRARRVEEMAMRAATQDPEPPSSVLPTEPAQAEEVQQPPPTSGDEVIWNRLAKALEIDHQALSDDDKVDLMTFELLNQSQARVERLIGLEVEKTESETWNYEAAVQMLALTQSLGKMPFGPASEILDLQPTAGGAAASRKGKEKEVEGKCSVFYMNPKDSKVAWLGNKGEPFFIIPCVGANCRVQ